MSVFDARFWYYKEIILNYFVFRYKCISQTRDILIISDTQCAKLPKIVFALVYALG